MAEGQGRRYPSGAVVAGAFVLAAAGGAAWWFTRPKADTAAPGPALNELDVVCLGRVDGLSPVAALEPAIPGKVVAVLVKERETVAVGQELVRLDDTGFKLREEEARSALAATDIEIAAAELDLAQHPNRVLAHEAALAVAADRVATTRRLLDDRRKQRMFDTITAGELAAFEAELRGVEKAEEVEQLRKNDLNSAAAGLKLRVAGAKEKKKLAEIAVRTAEQAVKDCVLRAPSAGTVLRVQTAVGETASPGHPRAPILFLPAGPLVVRVELEQEFLPRVSNGAKATIRDDTRIDSPTWNGRVLSVAPWVGQKRSIVLEPGILNDVRTVECVISIDPPPADLVVGQRMRVQIGRN